MRNEKISKKCERGTPSTRGATGLGTRIRNGGGGGEKVAGSEGNDYKTEGEEPSSKL